MSFVTTDSDGLQHAPLHKIRTASSHSSVQLAHPTPDLQSIQGAYIQNVERLEERAERMSVGSDLGEEIRKLHEKQKLSDSRRASIYADDAPTRSRNLSTSSFANSIVEVNSAARQGGYSPYSPLGSLRSGSWSQVSHPVSGSARSMSRSSRLGMVKSIDNGMEPAVNVQGATMHDDLSIQNTPRPKSKSESPTLSDLSDEDTREKRMKRLSTGRLPSDGSFTRLYNQLAETNQATLTLSGVRVTSHTSFTDIYDQIAGEIKDQLDTSVIGVQERQLEALGKGQSHELGEGDTALTKPDKQLFEMPPPPPPHQTLPVTREDEFDVNFSFGSSIKHPGAEPDKPTSGPMRIHVPDDEENSADRPPTASSQDTFQQAQGLFQDFDGIHYTPSIRSNIGSLREQRDPSSRNIPVAELRQSPMLKVLNRPDSMAGGVPPPENGMVFYPAPVPRVLNLPQRISQMPSAAVLAKRKTQMLGTLPEKARKSAPWLSRDNPLGNPSDVKASKMNLATLPPQLRASMFFDPGNNRQDVEIRDQSAMKTLDDLLDASALAPVGAFTDHPFAGKGGGNISRKSENQSSLGVEPDSRAKKQRKSSFLGLGRRASVGSDQSRNPAHSEPSDAPHPTTNLVALDDSAPTREPNSEIGRKASTAPMAADTEGELDTLRDQDAAEEGHEDDSLHSDDFEPEESFQTVPTTLLAELEMRKQQQKNRNRTAFNAFPNGMHATLLELDDVAQLQKVKRNKKRVALAWEDPADDFAEGDDDDEVPLGVLYAGQSKMVQDQLADDWDRPLGLLEQKQLEENEPLSRRRMRLLGINPHAPHTQPATITDANEKAGSESEHEGETLGQRMKRLRAKKALDEAIGDVEARPVSAAFSVDLLSQLGVEANDNLKAAENKDLPHTRNASQGQISTGSAPKSPGGGLLPPSRSHATTPGASGDDSEEETLGQRRARLQRESLAATRRRSQMMLNQNVRTSAFLGPGMDPAALATPSRTPPPLRASRSLADLLAAYPTGKNDARKVSDEMLMSTLPQGSLLAQEAEKSAAKKARMRMSSAEHFASMRPAVDYHVSNHSQLQSGAGAGMYLNQQQMYGMWQQNMYAGISSPNMLDTQQYPGSGMNMALNGHHVPIQAAGGGITAMQMPHHGALSMGGFTQQYPIINSAGQMHQPVVQDVFLDHKTRSRVDAWRQSVMN